MSRPAFDLSGEKTPQKAPGVWLWYRLYAGLSGLAWLMIIPLGFYLLGRAPSEFSELENPNLVHQLAWLLIFAGFLIGPMHVTLLFLPKKPWAWPVHLVAMVSGVMTCLFAPCCLPLLIFWFQPRTRAFFDVH